MRAGPEVLEHHVRAGEELPEHGLAGLGAFRFSVMLFLLRFTDMKYVASPPTKGGQARVSSPLPGSSTLMTSAPMSPSDIGQNGPASTRVRSMHAHPACAAGLTGVRSSRGDAACASGVFATRPPVRACDTLAMRRSLAARPRAARRARARSAQAQVREVVDVVDRLDRRRGAPILSPRVPVAVAEEPRAALELDERQVERDAESLGRRVQRGEGDDLAESAAGVARVIRTGWSGQIAWPAAPPGAAARTARRRDGLAGGQRRASSRVTQLLVASPPMDWASADARRHLPAVGLPGELPDELDDLRDAGAASGWPRAFRPPEGFTGSRPSSAVSPSSVARPALPGGSEPGVLQRDQLERREGVVELGDAPRARDRSRPSRRPRGPPRGWRGTGEVSSR